MARIEINDFVLNTDEHALLIVDVRQTTSSDQIAQSVDTGADLLLVQPGVDAVELSDRYGLPVVTESDIEWRGASGHLLGSIVIANFDPAWNLEELIAHQTKQVLAESDALLTSPEHVKTSRRLIDFLAMTMSYRD